MHDLAVLMYKYKSLAGSDVPVPRFPQSTSYKDLHVVGGTARGIGLVFIVGGRSGETFIPAGLMLFLL